MLRSVKEAISVLSNNKDLFEVLFEKRNMEVTAMEAESYIKESQSLAQLEQLGLINSFQETVSLGGDIEAFLSSVLVAGGGNTVLFNYSSLFRDIDSAISLYYKSVSDNRDGTRHLKTIYGLMKKIPHNLISSFNSIRIHVEFTYKSARDSKEKIEELHNYKDALKEHSQTIDDIKERLMQQNAFFETAREQQLLSLRNMIDDTVANIRVSLIRLTEDVIRFINRAEQSTKFYKHLQGILELCDRREFVTGSNAYELVATDRFALASGYTAVPKKHRAAKLHPEYCETEAFETYVSEKRKQFDFIEPVLANDAPIESVFLEKESVIYVDYEDIMESYLASGRETPFLHYMLDACSDQDPAEVEEHYLSLIVVNEARFRLIDSYTEVSGRLCIDAIPSSQQTETY
jgi:hypothetical protein